jgi:hypothetical protein
MNQQFETEKPQFKSGSFLRFCAVWLVVYVPAELIFYLIFGNENSSFGLSTLHSLLVNAPALLLAWWWTMIPRGAN